MTVITEFPLLIIGVCCIRYVQQFKYLGHNGLTDDEDIGIEVELSN